MDKRKSLDIFNRNFDGENINAIEIGVYTGNNAYTIYSTLYKKLDNLFLVDTWDNVHAPQMTSNMKVVAEKFNAMKKVWMIRQESKKASFLFSDNYFDYIYIDDCHGYNQVYAELPIWWKKLKNNGMLAGHDYQLPGVHDALNQYIKDTNLKLETGINPNIGKRELKNKDWWIWKK